MNDRNFTYKRVGRGTRYDTAYAVYTTGGTFLGYVVGRSGGWDMQATSEPTQPVKPTHSFTYHMPSREYAAYELLDRA